LLTESEVINVTTTVIDAQTRSQHGVIESTEVGSNVLKVAVIFEVSGRIIEGSNFCEPIGGSIEFSIFDSQDSINNNIPDSIRSYKKSSENQFWTVSDSEEYWVNSIGDFHCKFMDQ